MNNYKIFNETLKPLSQTIHAGSLDALASSDSDVLGQVIRSDCTKPQQLWDIYWWIGLQETWALVQQVLMSLATRIEMDQSKKIKMEMLLLWRCYCYLIFAFLHLFFAKKQLFLALIFCNLLYLFCIKLFSPSEIIFTNDEHVFLRTLVTNLRVLWFDTMLYPLYVHRIIKVDSINCIRNLPCEHTHLFGMKCHCYILVGIINW